MTREEEIHIEFMKHLLLEGYSSDCFEHGAKWADEHPVNPWHKVSEELPEVDKYSKCVKVLVQKKINECVAFFVAFFSPVAGFSLSSSFYTEYMLFDIDYWMYIPEIKED